MSISENVDNNSEINQGFYFQNLANLMNFTNFTKIFVFTDKTKIKNVYTFYL